MKLKWFIPPIISLIIISILFYILHLGSITSFIGPILISIIIVSILSIYGIYTVMSSDSKEQHQIVRVILYLVNIAILIGYNIWFLNGIRGFKH